MQYKLYVEKPKHGIRTLGGTRTQGDLLKTCYGHRWQYIFPSCRHRLRHPFWMASAEEEDPVPSSSERVPQECRLSSSQGGKYGSMCGKTMELLLQFYSHLRAINSSHPHRSRYSLLIPRKNFPVSGNFFPHLSSEQSVALLWVKKTRAWNPTIRSFKAPPNKSGRTTLPSSDPEACFRYSAEAISRRKQQPISFLTTVPIGYVLQTY